MNQLLCHLCLSGHSSLRLNERSLTVMTQVSLDLTFTSPQSPTLPLHIDDSLPRVSQMYLKLVLSAAGWWTTQFSGYPSCKSPLPPAGIAPHRPGAWVGVAHQSLVPRQGVFQRRAACSLQAVPSKWVKSLCFQVPLPFPFLSLCNPEAD